MERKWWQEAVGYEIYCKSFCDSDGDGLGDLRGVISKLPVLKELGITCIWFAPIYASPQADNGYDVADYESIEPAYGDLTVFKELLDTAHSMGIRVIMDMVLNHSSDEHRWFRESRKSKDNPYRNYYIWQPPKADGSEPNNWGGYFNEGNGSAWQYDEMAGEYYLHQYGIKMPDLNWEYRPLREDIYKMLNFWLDFGVDGFRLDVISRLKKMPGFPDSKKEPAKTDRNGFVIDRSMCTDVEGIHDILRELNERAFGREDCMTMGEGAGITSANALNYIAPERKELDCVYHFELASRTRPAICAADFRSVQKRWAEVWKKGGWSIQYLSNHDSRRQVSHHGEDGIYRTRSAKLLATLLHTSPGIPFIYQGEEIGMVDVRFDSIEDYNCCYTVGPYRALVENGYSPEDALAEVAVKSRDNARTPYQWDDSENAGFTKGKPWLKVNPRYREINLKKDLAAPDSIFRYYQKLIALRHLHPAVVEGELSFYLEDHPQILCYTRSCEAETLLVIANFGPTEAELSLPEKLSSCRAERILTNCPETAPNLESRTLLPWEAAVYRLEA
ncbi:MAG: alpha-glucosidase [Clostridia bacterium]|nr:alpha-glucosidase [Clostridia bacterium]